MPLQKQQTERFLMDDTFLDWVKYPTPEKDLYWKKFFDENPTQEIWAKEARRIIEMTLATDQPAEEIYSTIKQRLLKQIENIEPIAPTSIKALWRIQWIQVAASIILVLGLAFLYYQLVIVSQVYENNVAEVQHRNEWKEVVNSTFKPQLVVLPDRSTVVLQPNSKIGYSVNFERDKREVVLSGEAFFEVESNPKMPFLVHANELVTKVLGTSFTIKSFSSDKQVQVDVKTGKVAICAKNNPKIKQFINESSLVGVVLVQNEKAEFNRSDDKITKIYEAIAYHKNIKKVFEFEDVPIKKVFDIIEKEYQVEIDVDEKMIENCTLTASLDNQHLFSKLDIICRVIQARYESIDGKIIVYAQKCK